MESLLFIIPLAISIGNCASYCCYARSTNRRLERIENFIDSQIPLYQSVPPSPSAPIYEYTHAPPGYGYEQQNLNVI